MKSKQQQTGLTSSAQQGRHQTEYFFVNKGKRLKWFLSFQQILSVLRRTADVICSGDVETPGTGSSIQLGRMGQVTIRFFYFFLASGAMCSLGCVNQKSFLGFVPFNARRAFSLMIDLGEMYALYRVIYYFTSLSISTQVTKAQSHCLLLTVDRSEKGKWDLPHYEQHCPFCFLSFLEWHHSSPLRLRSLCTASESL